MYEYKATIVRVVDGDTVDVDIDLGFDVWVRSQRIRLFGLIHQNVELEIRLESPRTTRKSLRSKGSQVGRSICAPNKREGKVWKVLG